MEFMGWVNYSTEIIKRLSQWNIYHIWDARVCSFFSLGFHNTCPYSCKYNKMNVIFRHLFVFMLACVVAMKTKQNF